MQVFSADAYGADPAAGSNAGPSAPKKIVFIAGGRSHDFGSHEHYAGCRILADTVKKTVPEAEVEILRNGWPAEQSPNIWTTRWPSLCRTPAVRFGGTP